MDQHEALAVFEDFKIRRIYDEKAETWYFSVVDVVAALIQQRDYQTARKYWKVLKGRLGKEGCQPATNCYQLKMRADDGKMRLTDVADPETLLRIVQSVPSPKADPIKFWLAKVGYERTGSEDRAQGGDRREFPAAGEAKADLVPYGSRTTIKKTSCFPLPRPLGEGRGEGCGLRPH